MKIDESAINLSSEHSYIEEHTVKETLNFWTTGNNEPAQNQQTNGGPTKVTLSSEGVRRSSLDSVKNKEMDEVVVDLNLRILREMIERLTGKKIRFYEGELKNEHPQEVDQQEIQEVQDAEQSSNTPSFGLEYDYHETYHEVEKTSFSAEGIIKTADGEEIAFSVDLNMAREFYQEEHFSLRMGEALKDPLVINFGGTAAQLTQTKFEFDIDSDGVEDNISFVTPQSGFLAFDRNEDGVINNGTELFGTRTGNGFQELSEFDEDGNGWIDENDSIYSRLQIWTKNSDGSDQLFALGQKGVGAIYLNNVDTSFDLKNEQNETDGKIRSTSIYLSENKQVGTIQQVDLVV